MADTDVTQRSKQETTPAGATGSQAAERGRHPLLTLRNEIDRLFDEASSMSPFSMFRFPWGRRSMLDVEPLFRSDEGIAAFAPPAEVDEREGEYRVRLEMPGMDEKAVDMPPSCVSSPDIIRPKTSIPLSPSVGAKARIVSTTAGMVVASP